jgi:hypothetical protein
MGEPAEVLGCLLGRLADDWHVQSASDHTGDLPERYALFGYTMIAGACGTLFKRKPEEAGGIEPVYCRPVVQPFADIGRDALLTRDPHEDRNEPVITISVDRRGRRISDTRTPRAFSAAAASCDATRGLDDVGAGTSSSVATRPGVSRPVPDVTISGRSVPRSAEPSASTARRSVSQFSLNLEKSWLKPV